MKAMYKVEKVDGVWSIINKEDNEVVATAENRDKARATKKELEEAYKEAVAEAEATEEPETTVEVAEDTTTITDGPSSATIEVQNEDLPKIKKTKNTEPVEQVAVANDEKVKGITKSNYQANLDRANELKERIAAHYHETGGFPSHRHIIKVWGYNISYKAIIRHKKNVKTKMLGLDEDTHIETTTSLPRGKKKTEEEAAA